MLLIVGLSALAQFGAAWMALRQMADVSGRYRFAWGCLSIALALMIERRAAPLWRLLHGEATHHVDAVLGLAISLLMLLGVWGIRRLFQDLRAQRADLELLARTDALTGLPNRREIMGRAQAELERGTRTRRPVSFLLLDLDHFKAVNDRHGHPVGDAVLQAVARAGQANMRRMDALGRIGGEEFLAVLPEADGRDALAAAERLRVAVARAQVATRQGPISVTVSMGIITHTPDSDAHETSALLDRLLARVDTALYEAKLAGRNRAAVVPDVSSAPVLQAGT
jgi:diguanylate cyclase (GGDEF)-like protein